MTVAPTALRVTVILLALAGIAGQVSFLDAVSGHTLGLTDNMAGRVATHTLVVLVADALVTFVCATLAIKLALDERYRQEASRYLALTFAAWSYFTAMGGLTLLFRPATPGLQRELFEAHFLVVELIGLVGIVRFSSIYPRELGPEELVPEEAVSPWLLPFHRGWLAMRGRKAPWIVAATAFGIIWGSTSLSGRPLSAAVLSPFMHVVRILGAWLVVMNLSRAWRCATEGDRDGLLWLVVALVGVLAAVLVLIGGNVLVAVTGFPEPTVAWRQVLVDAGSVAFLWGVAMAVLHRPASDPGAIILRTTAIAASLAAGLFLAAGLEALFSGSVSPFSLRPGIGTAISFAVILSTHSSLARLIKRMLPF